MKFRVKLKLVVIAVVVHVSTCRNLRKLFKNNLHRRSHDHQEPQDMSSMHDSVHGVKMGIPLKFCDDGKHGIGIDWNPKFANSSEEYTCFPNDVINVDTLFLEIEDHTKQRPSHICLDRKIEYADTLPLSGRHRPLWPKFGEYKYLPPQRWVHSLEHGAVVMLYHPCMGDEPELAALKSLVRDCLGKHIISPYRHIKFDMPYAVLTYKHGLLVGLFDPRSEENVSRITDFIKEFALRAPETGTTQDGQYDIELKQHATDFSDLHETKKDLCAFLK